MELESVDIEHQSKEEINKNFIQQLVSSEALIDKNVDNSEYILGSQTYQLPRLFSGKILLELCNSSWTRSKNAKEDVQPYLRGCKWSPDGTCCLSVVNNDGVHVTELPRDLYEGSVTSSRMIDILDSVIHVKEAGLIYDFCWYPGMNSANPETCW